MLLVLKSDTNSHRCDQRIWSLHNWRTSSFRSDPQVDYFAIPSSSWTTVVWGSDFYIHHLIFGHLSVAYENRRLGWDYVLRGGRLSRNKLGDFKRRLQSELSILVTRNGDGLSAMETMMGMIMIFGKQETIPDRSISLIVPGEHLDKTKHEAGRTTVVYSGSTEHLETFTLMNCHSRHQSHLEGFGTGSTDPQEGRTRCCSSVGVPVTVCVS